MAKPAAQTPAETMGARIRRARETRKLTQDQLGEQIGVSRAAVAQWELDQTSPLGKRMVALAAALNVTEEWLSYGVGPAPRAGAVAEEIPLLSREEAAGHFKQPETRAIFYESRYRHPTLKPSGEVGKFAFALEVGGPALAPKFAPGDIVIIDPDVKPDPGNFVFAILDGEEETVFGRYRPRGKEADGAPIYELAPVNPDFPTHYIDGNHRARIIGTMVEHRQFRGTV